MHQESTDFNITEKNSNLENSMTCNNDFLDFILEDESDPANTVDLRKTM